MNKLINAKINFSKIEKDRLFKGQQGEWLDLTIWINEKPDQYGNDVSIEQRTGKDEKKIYLGNGKFYVKKAETGIVAKDEYQGGKKETGSMSNTADLPGSDELSDLPF